MERVDLTPKLGMNLDITALSSEETSQKGSSCSGNKNARHLTDARTSATCLTSLVISVFFIA